MRTSPIKTIWMLVREIPGEFVGIVAFAVAIGTVIAAGHAFAGTVTSPGLAVLTYVGPGAAAFTIYRLVTRRP